MELSATVAARITALREAETWSLSSLAGRAGIGKATLSEIEAGRRNPTLETLYAIAGALGVPLVELIRPTPGGERPVVEGAAVTATLLESWADPGVTTELYRLHIRPGTRQVSPAHGPLVTEHLTVVSGRVVLGPVAAPFEAGAGEYVTWKADTEHVFEAIDEVDAVLVIRHPA